MSSGINLATNTQETVSKQVSPHIRTVRYVAVGVLFLVAAVSVVFFLLIATSPLSRLKQQEADSLQTLSKYNPDIVKLLRLEERASSIDTILKARPSLSAMTDSINNKLPEGVTMQAFQTKGRDVSVTLGSSSLSAIDDFINKAKEGVRTKEYSRVVLKDLNVDSQHGLFVATIEIVFL